MWRQQPLVGIFDDGIKVERAMQQLRRAGIAENQLYRIEKSRGGDISHATPDRKETNEGMKPVFTVPGIPPRKARYYEDAYEAGYVLLVVFPGKHRREAIAILTSYGAYYDDTHRAGQPGVTGAMTPGMRGEDSSTLTGVANTAGGEQAAIFDPAIIEADLQHAQRVFQEKYQARKAQGLE